MNVPTQYVTKDVVTQQDAGYEFGDTIHDKNIVTHQEAGHDNTRQYCMAQ